MSRKPNLQRKYGFSPRDLEQFFNEWWLLYFPRPRSLREIKESIRNTKQVIGLIEKTWFKDKAKKIARELLKENLQWLEGEKEKWKSKGGPRADIAFNVLLLCLARRLKIDRRIQWQDILWLIRWASKNILNQTDFKSLLPSTNEKHLKSRYEHASRFRNYAPKKLLQLI